MLRNPQKYILRLTVLLITLMGMTQPGFTAEDCEDYSAVRVEGKSVLGSDTDYLKVRTQLLDSLLVDAVAQVNGAQIRVRETSMLREINGEIDSRYDARTVRASKGLVKSYSFPPDGETVISEPGLGRMLSMMVDVIVCNQAASDLVYVSMGKIAFPQFEEFSDQYLKEFVRAAIPATSKLRLIGAEDDVSFYDYVITGKILNLSTTVEDSAVKALIGNVVRTSNGRPIVDSRQYRMSATIALKAENAVDKSYTVVTKTVEKMHSSAVRTDGALEQRMNEFVGVAVGDVSELLFKKIINQEGFKQPFRRD